MAPRKLPSLDYEIGVGYPLISVAGSDEVGRGCLAGPVVAAAILLPDQIDYERHSWLLKVRDSKQVAAPLREELDLLIRGWAASIGVGVATVKEIDEINIFHASHLAIQRALHSLEKTPQHILIDGKFLPRQGLEGPATAVVQGDQKCLSIAAASIVAKVWRDQYMRFLDEKLPGYGFAQHKGYPTAFHSLALKKKGISSEHRRSFSTVAALA